MSSTTLISDTDKVDIKQKKEHFHANPKAVDNHT
jgi:hypothetical protein